MSLIDIVFTDRRILMGVPFFVRSHLLLGTRDDLLETDRFECNR